MITSISKSLLGALAILILTSCTTIDKHVEDWPELKTAEHIAGFWEIQQRCYGSVPILYKLLGGVAMGCAYYDLDAKTCDIYVPFDATKTLLEHEREHCKGGDHNGAQQKVFDAWRKKNFKTTRGG